MRVYSSGSMVGGSRRSGRINQGPRSATPALPRLSHAITTPVNAPFISPSYGPVPPAPDGSRGPEVRVPEFHSSISRGREPGAASGCHHRRRRRQPPPGRGANGADDSNIPGVDFVPRELADKIVSARIDDLNSPHNAFGGLDVHEALVKRLTALPQAGSFAILDSARRLVNQTRNGPTRAQRSPTGLKLPARLSVRGRDDRPKFHARALVEAILALGLEVIGEGVETPEQPGLLRQLQCPLVQGRPRRARISALMRQSWPNTWRSRATTSERGPLF
jgi:hypothetical protein